MRRISAGVQGKALVQCHSRDYGAKQQRRNPGPAQRDQAERNSYFVTGPNNVSKEVFVKIHQGSMVPYALMVSLLLVFGLHTIHAEDREYASIVVSVTVDNSEDMGVLEALGFLTDGVVGSKAVGLVTSTGLKRIQEYGFKVEVLDPNIRSSQGRLAKRRATSYRTFDQILQEMKSIASDYPSIASVDTCGNSVQNRPIVRLVIGADRSDGRGVPHYGILGGVHGHEKIGYEASLAFARYMAAQYGNNPKVTTLIDSSVFHILSAVNPDGIVNSSRENARYTDLNRDYGFQMGFSGQRDGGSPPFSQPETRVVEKIYRHHPWLGAVDFHSGIYALFYSWFCSRQTAPPDSAMYSTLARLYAQSVSMSQYGQAGKISYTGAGVSCDYFYGKGGTIAFTSELYDANQGGSFNPPASSIETTVDPHVKATVDFFSSLRQGVRGKVTDRDGNAVYARITVKGQGRSVYTSQFSGVFHKHIASSGGVTVAAQANGFKAQEKTVQLVSGQFVSCDFVFETDTESPYSAMSVEHIRSTKSSSVVNWFELPLGAHDGTGITLATEREQRPGMPSGSGSDTAELTLDMGPGTSITDGDGNDFTVYCANADKYWVEIGNDLHGSWEKLGTQQGTGSYDISSTSLDKARFIRIRAASGAPSIDAVEAMQHSGAVGIVVSNAERHKNLHLVSLGNGIETIVPGKGCRRISIYDIKGSRLAVYTLTSDISSVPVTINSALAGAYIVKAEYEDNTAAYKRFITW
jgi:hypothetical protein